MCGGARADVVHGLVGGVNEFWLSSLVVLILEVVLVHEGSVVEGCVLKDEVFRDIDGGFLDLDLSVLDLATANKIDSVGI